MSTTNYVFIFHKETYVIFWALKTPLSYRYQHFVYVVKNSVVVVDQTILERSQMPHMSSVEQEPETHRPVVASLWNGLENNIKNVKKV